jgi:uncharacterized protein
MNYYYMDASAWLKRYYREEGTDWVQHLFSSNATMICSSLGVIEVWSALVRKAETLKTPAPMLQQKLDSLEEDWDDFYEIRLSKKLIEAAKDAASSHLLRASDAIHLASALAFRKRLLKTNHQVMFISSDRELVEAALKYDITCLNPEAIK